jgi:hypothetical protein
MIVRWKNGSTQSIYNRLLLNSKLYCDYINILLYSYELLFSLKALVIF